MSQVLQKPEMGMNFAFKNSSLPMLLSLHLYLFSLNFFKLLSALGLYAFVCTELFSVPTDSVLTLLLKSLGRHDHSDFLIAKSEGTTNNVM